MNNFPTVQADITSEEYREISDDILNLLGSLNPRSEIEFFKQLGWYVVGILEYCETTGETYENLTLLDQYITDRVKPYAQEDAILDDLYDVFWWGDITTAVGAANHLKNDLNRFYDDALVKTLAMDLLYGKGHNLLNYQ